MKHVILLRLTIRIKHTVSSAIGHLFTIFAEQRSRTETFALKVPVTFGNVTRHPAGAGATSGRDDVKNYSHALSLFLWQRLLLNHAKQTELRVRWGAGDGTGFL